MCTCELLGIRNPISYATYCVKVQKPIQQQILRQMSLRQVEQQLASQMAEL